MKVFLIISWFIFSFYNVLLAHLMFKYDYPLSYERRFDKFKTDVIIFNVLLIVLGPCAFLVAIVDGIKHICKLPLCIFELNK